MPDQYEKSNSQNIKNMKTKTQNIINDESVVI